MNQAKPTRIAVMVQDGTVSGVYSDVEGLNIQVAIIDSNIGAFDDDDLTEVRDLTGDSPDEWSVCGVITVNVGHLPTLDWDNSFRDPDTEEPADIFAGLDETDVERTMGRELLRFLGFPGSVSPAELLETFNPAQAAEEGWCIIDANPRGLEIEADHDSDIFCRGGCAYDDDAVAFVRRRSGEGSLYHRYALAIHDAVRAGHEAEARSYGYTVFELPGRKWAFMVPGGGSGVDGYETAADAWTGAYVDAVERELFGDEG